MQKRDQRKPNAGAVDELVRVFDDVDYRVEADDFILYELARLIEEDRASFEDEEFRGILDEGIHEHIENNLDIRAEMSARLRAALPGFDAGLRKIAQRTLRALEDIESPLQNASAVVHSYTAYMFRRLNDTADPATDLENEARSWIERWQHGEILREEMTKRLKEIGTAAVAPLGDLLFDAPEERFSADAAIDTLGAIRSSSSARVLAHAILEPLLSEELEMKAYQYTRALWPLPRHYVLHTLMPHTHEDLSFRWFQLLVECDELGAVDLIIEEVAVHAEDAAYREDLCAIIELLRLSRDPQVEEKMIAALNDPKTSQEAVKLLQDFASSFRPSPQPASNPWSRADRLSNLNKQYLSAVDLADAGKHDDALRKLDAIRKEASDYPFAIALKRNLKSSST